MEKKIKGKLISVRVIKVLSFLFLLAFGFSFFLYDKSLLVWIQSQSNFTSSFKIADFLSTYGRLEWSTICISFFFFLISLCSNKRKKYAYLAKVSLLGGILAGLSVWPPKTVLGRERPRGSGNDSLHFLKFNPRTDSVFYSLPSGHAASTMGTAFSVFMTNPILGTPLIVLALLTGWSRIKLNEHWPSDVMAGWLFGIICGYWVFKRSQRSHIKI